MNSSLSTRLRSWVASQTWWSRVADALKLRLASKRASANPHAQDIAAEQIRLLYDQLPSALVASVVIGALAGYVLWNRVPHWALVLWLVALGALTVARVGLRSRYVMANPPPSDSALWARRFILGTASAGVIWGFVGLFPFTGDSLLHEMFIAFILAGLSAGGMTTLSSYRGAYLAFLTPAIAPYAIRLVSRQSDMHIAMGLMLFMFICMMLIISMRHYRSVAASLRLRYENLELLADRSVAAERLEGKVRERTQELAEANVILSHQATHDTLTGLVNRAEFERRLTHLLASASPHNPHALLYLDLDQFKVVNDTCGHVAGDDLLRQISALLRTKLRARDTLARLGGDEFGVLLDHCPVAEAKRVADALRELLRAFRFGWQDKSFTIGVSIGLVPLAAAGETLSSVFSAADAACYAAKETGRNRVHLYQADDRMLAQRDGEMRWIPRIEQALSEGRFRLYYQPIHAFGPWAIRHGEILLRMVDEQGRIVLPGAFIPAAERYGLMLTIDQWVVSKSLEALKIIADDAGVFTINISGQSLGAAEFLEFVTDRIKETRVTPDRLCFEITETAAVSELGHVLRFINTLKGVGCRFALDDFGTGLSSFSYLKTLPVDYLKIDGSFIRELAADDIDRAMVEAVNRIGHRMGLSTIAEGVESEAVARKVEEIGVDYGQGYGLAKPQPLHLGHTAASTRAMRRAQRTSQGS